MKGSECSMFIPFHGMKGSSKLFFCFHVIFRVNQLVEEWSDPWLVNLGAADGACDQDIPRQDNLERSFLGSNDVANCLLRDGNLV